MVKNRLILSAIIIVFFAAYNKISAAESVFYSKPNVVNKSDSSRLGIFTDTARLNTVADRLAEVVVEAKNELPESNIMTALTVETVGKNYFIKNNEASFAKTLTSVPGISSMDIGSGVSKPVIRGLGFNRVAVVDKSIVQQNQQWGADHGLEIDQYDVDNVRIHKGPMSLLYGSDAIGGVIEILPPLPPKENRFWGDITLIGKSNNDLLGTTLSANLKRNRWLIKTRITTQHYGDYRIPTDTIIYLTWKMPVANGRLKNTAGREHSASLSVNYNDDKWNWWLHVSNIFSINGFFPGSHGIPNIARLADDGSHRNVEMPYSDVNHFKAISNTSWRISPQAKLSVDLGFQQNTRSEWSKFHTHYNNQQPPMADPDLELSFRLNTATANIHLLLNEDRAWSQAFGLTSEIQHNRVRGYSFLLPNFKRITSGVYFINTLKFCNHFSLLAGVRYDFGRLNIEGYYDSTFADYLLLRGYSADEIRQYAWRASELKNNFNDFSGSVGLIYRNAYHTWRVNMGKSFRYPSANELASNGIHHGAFRHEQGNINLKPEQSYQLDAGYEYSKESIDFSATPFVSYFSNYIFLEPTGEWSILPHSGQIYRYRQAQVWLVGGEVSASYMFLRDFSASVSAEYIYNLNTTDGYPLPFSVPAKISFDISYIGLTAWELLKNYSLKLGADYVFAQNRIARNELKTPAAFLLNISANAFWKIGKWSVITDFRVQNVLNTAYLNHLSFYRKLNAPEPGRNIQLIVKVPFSINK